MSTETDVKDNNDAPVFRTVVEQKDQTDIESPWAKPIQGTETETTTETTAQTEQAAETVTETAEATETKAEEQVQTAQEEAKTVEAVYEDDKVLAYLEEKGISVKSFEDLKPKEQRKLSQQAEEFADFQEKTNGRPLEDFLEMKKDWKAEPKETVLRKLLKEEYPTLSDSQRERMYIKTYGFDKDVDEDDFIEDQTIKQDVDYQRALGLFEKQKSELLVPRGAEEFIPKEYIEAKTGWDQITARQKEYEEGAKAIAESYLADTNSVFTDSFEGFKTRFGNEKEGFVELQIKPANVSETKKRQSDLGNFNQKFFDQTTGKLTDAPGLHRAYFFADNPDLVSEHFYNLGKAAQVEANEKESKNITMDKGQPMPNHNPNKESWSHVK